MPRQRNVALSKPCGHSFHEEPDCAVCKIFKNRDIIKGIKDEARLSTMEGLTCAINQKKKLEVGSDTSSFKPKAKIDTSLATEEAVKTYLERIEQLNNDMPSNWQGLPFVRDAYVIRFKQICNTDFGQMPAGMAGRGVVTCVGGAKYFACAWAQIATLRRLGSTIPVEIWHMGASEMDEVMKVIMASLGNITFVDALVIAEQLPSKPRILNGWELKPFSIIHSSFKEVLFLDADCIPLHNPEHLFEGSRYQEKGSIFWPDIPPSDRKEWLPPVVWENCGMTYSDEVDFESGQMLIDKEKCWKPLQVAMWMNEHSDYYYKFVFGDKSTYHLAWRGCGFDYAMPRSCDWRYPALFQYGMDSNLLFLHCCRGKELLFNAARINSLPEANRLQNVCQELKSLWNGKIYDFYDQSYDEYRYASALAGVYKYRRLVNDEPSRLMVLGQNGSIDVGGAKCEKRWSVRVINNEINLVIVGEAHKDTEIGMMFLKQDGDGVWRGSWTAHERCAVELLPAFDEEVPQGFYCRPNTWDENIYKSITVQNEYAMPIAYSPNDVIIDLGAHIGSFSYAAAARGARRIIAFEPESRNFMYLRNNLKRFGPRVTAVNKAVKGQKGFVALLSDKATAMNTGGFRFEVNADGTVEAITLDEIIDSLNEPRIRLIKIDVEGDEFDIIKSCTKLDRVDEIAGEYHVITSERETKLTELEAKLQVLGFSVEYFNEVLDEETNAYFGIFKATR